MSTLAPRAARRLSPLLVGLLFLTMLAPVPARAATDLTLGGIATVANTDGGVVLLRTDPSWDATVLTSLPDGTVVDVLDGPFFTEGGSAWYAVIAWGQEGFLPADFLVGDGGGGGESAEAAPAETVPVEDEFVAATGETAIIAATDNDGARCRAEASYAGAVLTVLAEGAAVALNGPAVGEWQPVVCAGMAGFVHVDFVFVEGGYVPSPDPVVEEGPAGDAPVEDVPAEPPVEAPVETADPSAVTGYAVVTGTNGDGVRCRSGAGFDASIITVLPEGTEVALTGAAVDVWQPVVCAETNGYVHADFLSAGGGSAPAEEEPAEEAPAEESTDAAGGFTAEAITGSAVVTGTNGGGLRCRSAASYDAGIITVLPEGSSVSLNGAAQGEWQPVTCAGSNGFVHTSYITAGGSGDGGSGDGGGSDDGGDTGGTGGTGGSATVSGTNGDGVRCRSGAGYDASIITVLAEGATVSLRGGASGVWQPVTCAGRNGYVHSDYLSYGGGGGDGGGGDDGGSGDGGSGGGPSSGNATVTGTSGGGLRCRSGAGLNAGVIVVLSEGASVPLRGAAQGEWQPVTCAGSSGFVHVDYITYGGGGGNDGGGDDGGSGDGGGGDDGGSDGGSGGLSVGDHAMTMANLNLRYEPTFSAGVATVAASGTVVEITGGASNGFFAVDYDGLAGYMHGDYLAWTDQPLSQRGGSGNDGGNNGGNNGGSPGNGAGTASGQAIVNFAMQYVGYPYVWAGEGPYGFDCSGFVMFVIRNVLGLNITHDMFIQYDLGTPVAFGNLQPGDIVFFQNTFRWGMSHNGIYIGNGQFVHAENESTGVRVSDINSQYYSSRYYGAVRFA